MIYGNDDSLYYVEKLYFVALKVLSDSNLILNEFDLLNSKEQYRLLALDIRPQLVWAYQLIFFVIEFFLLKDTLIYIKMTGNNYTLDLLAPDPFRIMVSKGGSL